MYALAGTANAQAFADAKSSKAGYSGGSLAPAGACEKLAELKLPEVVQISARAVAAEGAAPAHCRVSGVIDPEDLPEKIRFGENRRGSLVIDTPTMTLEELEKEYIKKILEKSGGNKYQTAHTLGIDRKTLYRKLAEIEGKTHPEE